MARLGYLFMIVMLAVTIFGSPAARADGVIVKQRADSHGPARVVVRPGFQPVHRGEHGFRDRGFRGDRAFRGGHRFRDRPAPAWHWRHRHRHHPRHGFFAPRFRDRDHRRYKHWRKKHWRKKHWRRKHWRPDHADYAPAYRDVRPLGSDFGLIDFTLRYGLQF